jgi:hypothetical protein
LEARRLENLKAGRLESFKASGFKKKMILYILPASQSPSFLASQLPRLPAFKQLLF